MDKRTKKILVLEDSSQSGYGGGQRITEEICKSISIKHKLFIIDSIDSLLLKKMKNFSSNINISNLKLEKYIGNIVLFNFMLIFKPIFIYIKYFKKTDIIYVTTRKQFFTAALMKIFFPNKKIFYHHHLHVSKGIVWKIFYYLVDIFSDKNIFASHYILNEFINKGILSSKKMQSYLVSPFPPAKWKNDDLLLSPTIPIKPFIIGYIGRLSKEKGIYFFIEVIRKLPPNLDFEAWIAGDGEAKIEILEAINKSELKSKIIYKGIVETDFNFYKQISLTIVPSFYINESIGLTALEAIQAGIPLLTSRNGNLGYFVENNYSIGLNEEVSDAVEKVLKVYKALEVNSLRKNNILKEELFKEFYNNLF